MVKGILNFYHMIAFDGVIVEIFFFSFSQMDHKKRLNDSQFVLL